MLSVANGTLLSSFAVLRQMTTLQAAEAESYDGGKFLSFADSPLHEFWTSV